MHGVIVATVIDNAAGGALRTVLETPRETGHATTDLNISCLRPVTDELRVKGRLVRRGDSIAVPKVDVESSDHVEEWNLVATGRVTLYISPASDE
jgi:acyl-coenzyme A thioesterase PaaI-like protein